MKAAMKIGCAAATLLVGRLTALNVRSADLTWNQNGTAWEEAGNWSGGRVPGPDDIAVFPELPAPVKNQPNVDGTVRVGGLRFENGIPTPVKVVVPGGWKGGVAQIGAQFGRGGVSWIVTGSGKIALGRNGICVTKGSAIVHPSLELIEDQAWDIGAPAPVRPFSRRWDDSERFYCKALVRHWDRYGNDCNLVLFGRIDGCGGLHKRGNGRMFYVNNASPTFSGDATIGEGSIEWTALHLKRAEEFSFGTGALVLDGGDFCFGAAQCATADCVPRLMNPVRVLAGGGKLDDVQQGAKNETPVTRIGGPLDLGGFLRVTYKNDAPAPPVILDGPRITLLQTAPASPGFAADTFECNGYNLCLPMPIVDGPGDAGNPLILEHNASFFFLSRTNRYAGPTIVSFMSNNYVGHQYGVVYVAPESRLGQGDLIVQAGGRVHLTAASNLASNAEARIESDALALGVIGVGYNGVPRMSADSMGVLAVDTEAFDAVNDLRKLGNGEMYLGSRDQGTFVGTALAPGKGNVYRLGGGSFGGIPGRGWGVRTEALASGSHPGRHYAPEHWIWNPSVMDRKLAPGSVIGGGLLTLAHDVLRGDANVTVGAMRRLGDGAVLLESAQSFTGALTVQGPDETPWLSALTWRGSYLEGVAQTGAGQSPFGSSTGPVRLLNSTIKLTGVTGGQPVSKGELTFAGLCNVALDANVDHPTRLTVSHLIREGRAVLTLDPAQEQLGDGERLVVTGWRVDRDLLPPYFVYASTKRWCGAWVNGHYMLDPNMTTGPDFLSYDATGGKGFGRFTAYATDLSRARSNDVARIDAGVLPGGSHTVRALKTTGDVTGSGRLRILNGGVILGGSLSADLDFGDAEGVIYGQDLGPNKRSTYEMIWDLTGRISGSNGVTIAGGPLPMGNDWGVPGTVSVKLSNMKNDFSGPVTVNGEALAFIQDKEDHGRFAAGSLGNLTNSIVLNGGYLCPSGKGSNDCLAASRTLCLGPGGGYIAFNAPLTIYARITGPGFLGQTIETGSRLIIANGGNDYSGGTWICNEAAVETMVTEAGRLGTGPVLVAKGCALALQGDGNIDPSARLSVAYASMVVFGSRRPVIGSLDGTGLVFLGVKSVPAGVGRPDAPAVVGRDTELVLGADNTDFTFYGTIRQTGEKAGEGVGSVTKVGQGVFTLYGGHTFGGPTTVAQGMLELRGGLAGNLVVKSEGALRGGGRIGGALRLEGGTFVIDVSHAGRPLIVAGVADIGGRLRIERPEGHAPATGLKWTVLVAEGGIRGEFSEIPAGCEANVTDGGRRLEVRRADSHSLQGARGERFERLS